VALASELVTVAIFFSCLCGQNLREADNRAGSQTPCPACGFLVRVPSPRFASPDDDSVPASMPALPVPPAPNLQLKAVEVASGPCEPTPRRPRARDEDDDGKPYRLAHDPRDERADDVDREPVRRRSRRWLSRGDRDYLEERRPRRVWKLEKNWKQGLLYPILALPVSFGLAAAWATTIAFIHGIIPDEWEAVEILARSPVLLVVFVLFAYTAAFLQATLAAAKAGEAGFIAWPGRDLGRTVRGGCQAVVTFLAGPVIPAGLGFYFWFNSGELEFFDWSILFELGIISVGYWALLMMVIQERDNYRDLKPMEVGRFVRRVGYRTPMVAVLLALSILGHGLIINWALESLHRGPGAWLVLVCTWMAHLSWMVFLLRWLGVSTFRVGTESR
jgi:hypothetical protein